MSNTHIITLSNKAQKQLRKIPLYIVIKLQSWIDGVQHSGLPEMMNIKGYHDEPLKGDRIGQRSIRLSRSYRAIYKKKRDDKLTLIDIIEVNNHEY